MRSSSLVAVFLLCTFAPAAAFAQAQKPAEKPDKPTDKPADKAPAAKPEAKPKGAAPASPGTGAAAGAGATAAPTPFELSPPPPPPWTTSTPGATSISGTQLMPTTPAATTAAPTATTSEEKTTIDNRFQMLEARLAADEQADKANFEALAWLRRFKVTGYLQPQLLWTSTNTIASPNLVNGALPTGVSANATIAKADGTTTNPDTFRLRRARLKVEFMPTDSTRFVMEIDPSLSGGDAPGRGTIARNVEAQGIARWSPAAATMFGVGIFKIPFGYEILQSDADRPFIERSWGEQNMFPSEFDTGAKAYTTLRAHGAGFDGKDGKLDFQVAIINGTMLGEPNFVLVPDLNKGKDFVGRVNFDFADWLDVGASAYYGQGQVVDKTLLKFKQFPRWAFNAELGLHHEWKKGWTTRILSELTLGEDMDRGLKYPASPASFTLPAIPAQISSDATKIDERSVFVRLEQDITEWVTVGARYDLYTPDTSLTNNARDTLSFVGVLHFTKSLQWMNEFDHAVDNVHKSGATAPSKQIETFSSVLQVRF